MTVGPRGKRARQLPPIGEHDTIRFRIDLRHFLKIAVRESRVVFPPANQEPVSHGHGERLRTAIGATPASIGERTIAFTVSVGVATAQPGNGAELPNLLAQADVALYEAKRAGRNQVRVAPPESGIAFSRPLHLELGSGTAG